MEKQKKEKYLKYVQISIVVILASFLTYSIIPVFYNLFFYDNKPTKAINKEVSQDLVSVNTKLGEITERIRIKNLNKKADELGFDKRLHLKYGIEDYKKIKFPSGTKLIKLSDKKVKINLKKPITLNIFIRNNKQYTRIKNENYRIISK